MALCCKVCEPILSECYELDEGGEKEINYKLLKKEDSDEDQYTDLENRVINHTKKFHRIRTENKEVIVGLTHKIAIFTNKDVDETESLLEFNLLK